ncbi:GNAT family N-acetyltransferase [Candidatus Enterococcus ikei]|uniref:GNAT family N-acetyltransferase n=1 Tax=Candidatus Enterococcus ikei TaxID=2815326 RepID=A0ABS3H2D6_9ENTE|nr:GNAT family N-acetyltransferase [Enterococcus sp. DIV0869a]MBO0441344.1 GNAT family N-acetyltransferase [Enterococcus sp. DIV0869a]
MLKAKPVSRSLPEYSTIIDLFKMSFPTNEQFPIWLLRLLSCRKGIEFLAFYDKNKLCGFTYLVKKENTLFILYLATNNKIRSQGYGSKILNWINVQYKNHEIALNIETVEKTFNNYEQRVKRKEFYLKNDYHDTNLRVKEHGVVFDVLSNSQDFTFEKYKKLIQHFTLNFYSPTKYRP